MKKIIFISSLILLCFVNVPSFAKNQTAENNIKPKEVIELDVKSLNNSIGIDNTGNKVSENLSDDKTALPPGEFNYLHPEENVNTVKVKQSKNKKMNLNVNSEQIYSRENERPRSQIGVSTNINF